MLECRGTHADNSGMDAFRTSGPAPSVITFDPESGRRLAVFRVSGWMRFIPALFLGVWLCGWLVGELAAGSVLLYMIARLAAPGLIEGIELTEREMQRLLAVHGVKQIEAEGQKFDPHKHQAMFEVPDPTRPEGTVVQVVQTGYAIGDRVLRPAMVGVAKGGGATGAPPAGEGHIDKNA